MKEKALEVRRKLFHLILGSIISFAVYYLKPVYGNLILAPLVLVVFMMLLVPRVRPHNRVSRFLYYFERKKDIEHFPFKGAIHYGAGVFFPILLLNVKSACAIIMVLSVGDAFSTLIGKFHGRTKFHRLGFKSAEGSLAFVVSAFVASLIFVDLSTALKLALVGAVVELISPWDDNFTVPVALTALLILLP